MNELTRPVWVEINLNNIGYNLKQVKENVSQETLIMAVVKADGYGHGAVPVARAAVNAGADRLAVALPEEGSQLRENGFELPIQVLGEVDPRQISLLVKNDLIATVCKYETAQALSREAQKQEKTQKIHIKIDTGMGRIGVFPGEAVDFIQRVNSLSGIKIEGIMTHQARADEEDKEYAYRQWERFNKVIEDLTAVEIEIPLKHVANSATVIDLSEMSMDLVRPGIMMYGLPPSHEVDQNFPLRPVLSWKTRIVYLKELPPGWGVSYGTTFIASEKRKIATLPLGYADGYPRLLSDRADVLIKGERAPIKGRVCMDQFMVDVTGIDGVEIGDEVVLIGRQEDKEITATELADLSETINYEIVTGISKRVPRIYV